ncbi:MAG TPA: FAD-dependent oxidoreductase [Vicinamibacterales bacterium]|jgi:glycerol-3-phosphate dehydrogenase|nr:FAD-dependent oxidoreductase [Vicinamibacterales bacterium]
MKPRDFGALTGTTFDLLIVGGGIHGLMAAREAAARGMKVALVERGDFAAATSFNHQRTAHGGLRSLGSGRIDLARDSIRERRTLARIAPRLLRPLPFIVGTYRSVTQGRLALRAGFRIDRWLSRKRNDGIEPELHLPPPRLTSRAATLKLFPGIRQDGLTGGASWYDYQVVYSSRLAIAVAEAADASGAVLVNYAEATAALREGSRVAGMVVRDILTNAEADVRATVTINAAGPRAGDVARMFGVTGAAADVPLVLAMNLVTSKPASDMALAAASASGRMLTLTPWHGRALVGTMQRDDFANGPDAEVSDSDIQRAIAEANSSFPALRLTRDEVTLVHRANVPAEQGNHSRAAFLGTSQIRDHAKDGVAGALTLVGVKFTTARASAARAVGIAARLLKAAPPIRPATAAGRRVDTQNSPLPGAGIADHEALAIETARTVHLELAPPIIRHLMTIYGDRVAAIVRLMAERSDWRMPLIPGQPNVGAEVIHAIRAEMAGTLADIVIRRTELGAMGYPGDEITRAAALIAAEELGWDANRRDEEIAAVREFYHRG